MGTFTASDGLRLNYVTDDFTDPWRPSDTVVLLHAAMGSLRRFYAWVPHLARDFRVVRLDLRGHGQSGQPAADQLTFERLGQDVVELFDHLGLERVHLAGSSAGAIVAHESRLAGDDDMALSSIMHTFVASDGLPLRYALDDFSDPWGPKQCIPDCKFVVYHDLPHNITDAVPEKCAAELRDFILR